MIGHNPITLTDFLLARIAEDRTWARQRRDEDFRKHRISAHRPHLAPDDAERVLAQCSAWLRIVEACSAADGALGDGVLRALASVYADHPDWREEWRPD
jgi:hypothetical protein